MDDKKIKFPIVLITVTALFILLFQLSYDFDNKYTYPSHYANMGIMVLDQEQYEKNPLTFLIDGWEYYADQLLTPQTIEYHTPDQYTYIGRYGGFDRGNPEKSPYGCATYRLTIFLDEAERTYALELPQIYTHWKLYMNGKLMASHEMSASHIVAENDIITFQASDKIEILVAVSAKTGLYSGLTYPPAFGSVKEVGNLIHGRLVIHTIGAAMAACIGILFLCIGLGSHYHRPYQLLFCICLCFVGAVSYPFVQAFHINGEAFSIVERLCYYGLFLSFVLLQANMLKLAPKIWVWMAALGGIVLLSICLEPFFVIEKAGTKYLYGSFLGFYKLLTGAWLLFTSIYGIRQEKTSSKPLLVCACIFSIALIMDRIHTLFEPIRFGWPVEIAGFSVICILSGVLWWDTIQSRRENLLLETQRQGLMEINQLKTEFLSGVSHELQAPIAVISGYAQLTEKLMEMGVTEYEEIYDNQRQIVLESDHMERMIRQLLDISRIESGCFQLDKEKVILSNLIANIVKVYFPTIDKNNNRIECQIANLPLVECDKERIKMVFVNLIQNACRHTQNGCITISAEVIEGYVQMEIRDTGEGIAPEVAANLFEQYLKKGNQMAKAAGTGLGLYLCKKTVEAHGGSIWVSSKQSVGTSVYFTLPF